jgi:hypothetical protein
MMQISPEVGVTITAARLQLERTLTSAATSHSSWVVAQIELDGREGGDTAIHENHDY